MTEPQFNTTPLPLPTGHNFKNLIGQKFGLLTVISFGGLTPIGRAVWQCECACGGQRAIDAGKLRYYKEPHCGCQSTKRRRDSKSRHGYFGTPIYYIWVSMLRRCRNPKATDFHNYGGRGIQVCERWYKFENFLADMGDRPSPQHSLDRIDNGGNYEPGNCRWATVREQGNNRRTNSRLTFNDKTQTLKEWARELHLSYNMLKARRAVGWSDEKILTTPARFTRPQNRRP